MRVGAFSYVISCVLPFRDLSERGLEIFDNGVRGRGRNGRAARRVSSWEDANQLSRDYVWRRKVGAVFQRLILQPEDVEIEFIALGYVF
jgi:hypothetical protein